jgi:LmbE family N-acetylglucosaminyl deacetylase
MSADPDLTRVLILATHPDDDVIAAAGIIQHALAAGGCLRVLFITNGENNHWAQRALLRKLRITAADRCDFARLRSEEAQRSLESIGAGRDCCFFLGYSDQHIWQLARSGDTRLQSDLERHASEFRPTLVIAPSFFDVHTDHRATAWFAHKAFGPEIPFATYIVHGQAQPMRTLFTIRLTPAEQQKKRDAIACHESQLLLSRHRFLAYAAATETFYAPEHDVVRVVSPAQQRLTAWRHALRAIAGALRR